MPIGLQPHVGGGAGGSRGHPRPQNRPQNSFTNVRPHGSLWMEEHDLLIPSVRWPRPMTLASDKNVNVQSVQGLGETCSLGSSSPVRATRQVHKRERRPRTPAPERSSQHPPVRVPAHVDFPLLTQFFLQVTFSCVAAASCRVANTNCVVLAASSLLRGSCPGISCG